MGSHESNLVVLDNQGATSPSSSWQRNLAQGAHSLSDLVELDLMTPSTEQRLREGGLNHRVCVSQYYLSLINRQDPACPIRAQAVPSLAELDQFSWEESDPIGDEANRVADILCIATRAESFYFLLMPAHSVADTASEK